MKSRRIHYFDYAATSPMDKRVFSAMRPYFEEEFGNPANLYSLGHKAKIAVTDAHIKIATALKCRLDEFVFTDSATEADNLAILGVARANKGKADKIIISNVEHKGILSATKALKEEGFEIIELPVSEDGLVSVEELRKMIDDRTALISVTSADSETGTVQPIDEIAQVVEGYRQKYKSNLPYFHTDAVQYAPFGDIDVQKSQVDMMTISAHKLYGPKGIGGLFVKKGVNIKPIIYGGGQQKLRSGTENVPAIVGFGEAIELAMKEKKKEFARIKKLRDKLEKGLFNKIDKLVLNGHPQKRLPNFLNISILDIEGEALLLHLDDKKIYVNTGSACNSQTLEPSYILRAMGRSYEYVHGSLRFTLGRGNTAEDVEYVIRELPKIVTELRKVSPLNLKLGEQKEMSLPKAFIGGQTPHFLKNKK